MPGSKRLSDAEFARCHAGHLASAWWRTVFRPQALAHYRYRCAVCGMAYQRLGYAPAQLIVDHKRYWKDGQLIFGHETFEDVRLMCPFDNRQGIRSDSVIRVQRRVYLLSRSIAWLVKLPFRLLGSLLLDDPCP
jgi:hypothetical protein